MNLPAEIGHPAGGSNAGSILQKGEGFAMWFLHLHDILSHLSHLSDHWAEAAITCGAALLVGCAASCICSPCKEKDDLFYKHVS